MLNVTALSGFGGHTPDALRVVSYSRNLDATTLVLPADIQRGDILLAINLSYNYTNALYPTGFTLVDQQQSTLSTTLRIITSYKMADGTEGGTTVGNFMGSSITTAGRVVFFAVIRPTAPGLGAVFVAQTWQRTDADPADVVIPVPSTPTGVFAVVRDGSSTHAPGIFTPTQDYISEGTTARGYYKIFNTNPQSVTLSMADLGTDNMLYGFSCSLR